MSRPTVSTGNIPFSHTQSGERKTPLQGKAMHIILLGDFTARANGGRLDSGGIGQRRLIEIDRDNFEDVFSALNIQLSLPVADEPLLFTEFDDLHPDFLYDKLPLFAELRSLQRRLRKPEHFAAAASEIKQWQGYREESQVPSHVDVAADADSVPGAVPLPGDLLDAILESRDSVAYGNSSGDSIDRLIKDIVAPYVRDKTDPELDDLLGAVAESGNQLMRRICHASPFQQLEASWRSIHLLVRRLETGPDLKIFLADVAREEVQQDLDDCGGQLELSGLYQLLVERHQVPGATVPALLNLDYFVNGSEADINLLSAFGSIAVATGAAVACGARTILAGCRDISVSDDPADWLDTMEAQGQQDWQALRQLPQSRRIALVAPRFLLRLPYGQLTSPIESFEYSELPEDGGHSYYLWGNSSYLLTLLLAASYRLHGWSFKPGQIQVLEDFPLHVYTDGDGGSEIKPCAEVMLTDSAAKRLAESGVLPVRSIKGRADIAIPQLNALADGFRLSGPWGS